MTNMHYTGKKIAACGLALAWFAAAGGAFSPLPANAREFPVIPAASQSTPDAALLDLETFRNNAFGAYQQALEEGKYTIILFDSEYCGFCKNLIALLRSKDLAKYSDQVVVSISDGDVDEGARQLEQALGVVRYPTLVVLKTNEKNIHVAGRIEGEVDVLEIDRVFHEAMKEPIAN